MDIFLNILFMAIGFALLVKGADFFVGGASGIAKKARVSEMVIGLTIVAFGTSAPEAAVSITAAISHSDGITVGNVLGSNVLNVLLILGLTAVIRPLKVQKTTLWIEIPFLCVITALFVLLGFFGENLTRVDGGILMALFVVFLVYTVIMAKKTRPAALVEQSAEKAVVSMNACACAVNAGSTTKSADLTRTDGDGTVNSETQGEENQIRSAKPLTSWQKVKQCWAQLNEHMWFMILITVIGLGMVVGGSMLAVEGAKKLAALAGVSDTIIGLTIVALGTSLPELVTSIVAAVKGSSDIAVGNIIGSNIFNLLFVAGLATLIMPVSYAPSLLFDGCVAIGAVVLTFFGALNRKLKLGRIAGSIMLCCFVAYWVLVILMGVGIIVI